MSRCASQQKRPPMAEMGLGCAKTPAVAPHVEISPSNCIPESQIMLHTRGSMPCWRIVFSTFCGCMIFTQGRTYANMEETVAANEVICPICKTKAQPLDKIGDADGFECATHERFCVVGSVFATDLR